MVAKGSFTNYVDKTRQVGSTGNVKGMQIFLKNSKVIPSPMSTVVNNGHNLAIVVKERPRKEPVAHSLFSGRQRLHLIRGTKIHSSLGRSPPHQSVVQHCAYLANIGQTKRINAALRRWLEQSVPGRQEKVISSWRGETKPKESFSLTFMMKLQIKSIGNLGITMKMYELFNGLLRFDS